MLPDPEWQGHCSSVIEDDQCHPIFRQAVIAGKMRIVVGTSETYRK